MYSSQYCNTIIIIIIMIDHPEDKHIVVLSMSVMGQLKIHYGNHLISTENKHVPHCSYNQYHHHNHHYDHVT